MHKNLILSWSNLIVVSKTFYSEANDAGVYIWGFTIDNAFVPYYVGIADKIGLRINEHISSILSGKYTIFHSASLANFKRFKNQDVSPTKSGGRIYCPTWPQRYKDFLDNRNVLQPHIDFMIDTFTFSFAVVDRDSVSKQDLKEVEKICINEIGMENLINTRCGQSDKITLNHIGCANVTANFTTKLH